VSEILKKYSIVGELWFWKLNFLLKKWKDVRINMSFFFCYKE